MQPISELASFQFGERVTGTPTRDQSLTCGLIRKRASSESDKRGEGGGTDDGDSGTAVIAEPKTRTKTPPLYRVILVNDDYTPMDFVIHVLQKFFSKDMTEATKIMLSVHQKGYGVCGTFTYEIAETKTYQVNQYSKQNRHPLKCVMEKD